ncbi:hypothetical protein BN2475_1360002 [Paraburkholderia ribeironis]|uniref:Uncharacterized protein n=1 Tax=Paraburkholderia ribeironis TaxID=1247936 RepID=A0A1N7SPK0_9BURK|nr:hypothetical protein BN2475_1360002 [Paraburkholderia ribeironis]
MLATSSSWGMVLNSIYLALAQIDTKHLCGVNLVCRPDYYRFREITREFDQTGASTRPTETLIYEA